MLQSMIPIQSTCQNV